MMGRVREGVTLALDYKMEEKNKKFFSKFSYSLINLH